MAEQVDDEQYVPTRQKRFKRPQGWQSPQQQ
jgi:hypothetical protein